MNVDLLDYAAIQVRNREAFLLNFRNDSRTFGFSLDTLQSIWARLGREKDTAGRSNAGLLVFVNILIRHAILGFHSIVAYQSAYLNVLDKICGASQCLLNSLCGLPSGKTIVTQPFDEIADSRAAVLATRNTLAKRVMEELGLWKFKASA
jgi:hypothetical protein